MNGIILAAALRLTVCLPATSPADLPSVEFMDAVNAAAQRDRNAVFRIVSRDESSQKQAKVILHSYGIREQQLEFATKDDACAEVPGKPTTTTRPAQFRIAVVVLGNRPLDDSTPTVDMVQRILTALPNVKGRPDAALVLTGGPTEGPISEARMMALIALSRGVSREQIFLEEESWTTGRNAALTAPIVERLGAKSVIIVSKKSHLVFAMDEFRKYPVFRDAIALESPELREESIQQMTEYLRHHRKPEIESRLEALKHDSHGVD